MNLTQSDIDRLADALVNKADALADKVAERVAGRVNQPILCSAPWLAWKMGCSADTIRRRREEYGIPWRNLHAMLWKEGDGPKLISLSEWKQRKRINTQALQSDLEKSNYRIAA